MIKRFIQFYRPHRRLLGLDMSMSVLGAVLAILLPWLTRLLLKEYIPVDDFRMICVTIGVMVLLVCFHSVVEFIRIKWGHILGVRVETDMRSDFFSHIQKLSFNYFDKVKTGHLMSRISNDLNLIAEVAHHAPEDLLISTSMIVGSFVMMFYINASLAFIALIPVPLMIAWGVLYGGKMRRGFRVVRRKIADLNSSVENSVQGIREVKSYANEEAELDKFEEVNCSFRLAKENMYGVMGLFFSGMHLLVQSYFLIVIAGGVLLMHFGHPLEAADLLAFTLYVHFILKPINRLVSFAEQFQQGAASFERFVEVMDIEPDIVDRKDAVTFEAVKGAISISNVSFKYASSTELVLEDVSIEIPASKTVAIVGESGAGKSTIASLIPRFYETDNGKITIDGHDIMDLKQRFLRMNIGLVQQNVFLFDSTIRENIMYGRVNATEEQLYEAAKKANIFDFIMSLPDGFDSVVGERGVLLSGGQKQRISIARVFLKDPPIFIFDEATSSLDTESEALIQDSLELLSRNRTTIVIAHRLSTVRRADFIYVLKQGRVVEKGTHEELLENKDYYHKLYSMNRF
ncbi:MAG: ABC transporter ATP-binding protein/permease [Phycisphaerae bacterium]|nr:ABC transporter ATP-binding protein/permease [Phycisphaerae bacterium]